MKDVLAAVAVIIRSYKNRHIGKRVAEYLSYGVGRVIVVINAAEDIGSTRGWLKHINDPRLHIVEIHVGFSWCNALNAGLHAVQISNFFNNEAIKFVFPASVEAIFKLEHLQQMLAEMSDPEVGLVGTDFEGRLDGNIMPLGRSYNHPRNTGNLIRLQAIQDNGPFDARCDAMGGMEDIDFILRIAVNPKVRWKVRMLNMSVRLILGQIYNQAEKEVRERRAMDKIIAYWRSICPVGGSEIDRVNRVVSEMNLEEDVS